MNRLNNNYKNDEKLLNDYFIKLYMFESKGQLSNFKYLRSQLKSKIKKRHGIDFNFEVWYYNSINNRGYTNE